MFSPYVDSPISDSRAVDVLVAGYGIVAVGPEVVLNPYIEILTAHGVACHLTSRQEQTKPQAVGLLMYKGFVVSEYMWAEQIL